MDCILLTDSWHNVPDSLDHVRLKGKLGGRAKVKIIKNTIAWILALQLPISFLSLGFVTIPVYWQLIFVMPLIGALGAFLSLQFGGSRIDRLASGLFPAFPMVIGYPLARIANRILHFTENTAPPTLTHTTGFLLMAIAVVGLSCALMVGTLPFLQDRLEQ